LVGSRGAGEPVCAAALFLDMGKVIRDCAIIWRTRIVAWETSPLCKEYAGMLVGRY